ncbi:MAG: ABC transporter ATP-binding protein, partial [Erysipelotrichales bacterium]|nr:ABC transporter ATP-binding protein [Erysipelotrichales bacterium]
GAKVILADEPTGNLDSANGRNIMEILSKLAHEDNYCVIVVTHDDSFAAKADEILRISDGLVVVNE